MAKHHISIHPQLPHMRMLALDNNTILSFNSDKDVLEVETCMTGPSACVALRMETSSDQLIHCSRISDDGNCFPILRNIDSTIYLSFVMLDLYELVCELCNIKPDAELCRKVQASYTGDAHANG